MKQLPLLALLCVVAAETEYEAPCINGPCAAPDSTAYVYPSWEDYDFYRGKLITRVGTVNPVCNQTREPGPCGGHYPRYYFDNVTKTCKKFIYGGCRGNGNNFVTIEECKNTCWASLEQNAAEEVNAFEFPLHPFAPPEVCTYPADSGHCKAYMPRFFSNTETKKCEQFIYGGCGGNANNFLTFDACEKKCLKVFGVIPRA